MSEKRQKHYSAEIKMEILEWIDSVFRQKQG